MPLVIVEGTCGSGKTTLVRAAPALFGHAVTVLPQRVTYAPIAPREDAGTLDDPSHLAILRGVVGCVGGALAKSLPATSLPRATPRGLGTCALAKSPLVLVDTLHATQFVRTGTLSVASFVEIDRALHELDALVVVLRIGEASVRERAIAARRGTDFADYARKFGATEEDRARYFVHEQARLLELLRAHSRLHHVVLDADQPVASLHAEVRRVVHAARP